MKKALIHSILVILILSVSYGGSGFSYMIYCCGECEVFGMETVLNHKCCDTHHHHTQNHHQIDENKDGSISFYHTEHESLCDMERITFDWTSAGAELPNIQPNVIDLGFFYLHHHLLPSPIEVNTCNDSNYLAAISIPPRDYLSLLTVLII